MDPEYNHRTNKEGGGPASRQHPAEHNNKLPAWHYDGTKPELHQQLPGETNFTLPPLDGLDLGSYARQRVTNLDNASDARGRQYFDMGLRLMISYQHELAAKCFLACLQFCPHAALAHALVALCHSPNYNFKGEPYYESACHHGDAQLHDLACVFPSQQVAERHSAAAVAKMEELKRLRRRRQQQQSNSGSGSKKGKKGRKSSISNKQQQSSSPQTHDKNSNNSDETTTATTTATAPAPPDVLSDAEAHVVTAVRVLTCSPGIAPGLSEVAVGRPYADAMRKAYQKYPDDPEIAYWFAEALMVLNAWQLYEYPSGRPRSPDVLEVRQVLERALQGQHHPHHPGLCHLYVHLSEMSAHPELALPACQPLRTSCPHAGHLIHMPTHIDVLVGDYEACVHYNCLAISADRYAMEHSPSTAGKESFYFGYIVHNYHMAVYGAMLGAMEAKAMEVASQLNSIVNEAMFREFPNLVAYLEAYSAQEIHILVRFGRWQRILEVPLPDDKHLMLFRTATLRYARALALAMLGDLDEAHKEADRFDTLRRGHPEAKMRILHNNSVAALLEVDAVMMRGELAYRAGKFNDGLALLRKAVQMQDNLNYDEPWGKMQPIRHALGGLLLEQNHAEEAESVFRADLKMHPKNPWALVGLIQCLKQRKRTPPTAADANGGAAKCCHSSPPSPDAANSEEIAALSEQLTTQRQAKFSDYNVTVACECCQHPI